MVRHAGRFGRVLMSTTLAGAPGIVISLNSWDMNMAADRFDVTSFFDGNKTYVIGLRDRQGNFGGFWDDEDDILWAGANSDDGVRLFNYPDFYNNPECFAYGPAWVDVSIAVPVNGAATVTAQWAAAGYFDITAL